MHDVTLKKLLKLIVFLTLEKVLWATLLAGEVFGYHRKNRYIYYSRRTSDWVALSREGKKVRCALILNSVHRMA